MTRLKVKYNPVPTAREKAFHLWLMDEFSCACGCGAYSECVHHPLTRHPEQRWRRDHLYVVPMADVCHRALHAMGRESLFSERNFADLAHGYRGRGQIEGVL